jgi:hypothetical protein
MPFDGREFIRQEALARIDVVIALIAEEERWCKGTLVNHQHQRCLLGAMIAAGADELLKPLVLAAARELTGGDFRTIQSFNDARATTHANVIAALRRARENIELGRHVVAELPPLQGQARSRLQRWYMAARDLI